MNSEYNMSGAEYELLYKRYLDRSPLELFDFAGDLDGKVVIDLCCGSNARATKVAFENNASQVFALDMNPKLKDLPKTLGFERAEGGFLLPTYINAKDQILFLGKQGWTLNESLSEYLRFRSRYANVVICQQGINYWFSRENMHDVRASMRDDGVFVFNTFWNKPSEVPFVKQYEIDNRHYAEVTHLNGDWIEHSVHAEGLQGHFTRFKWIPTETFKSVTNEFFNDVEVKRDGGTDIYICRNPKRVLKGEDDDEYVDLR